MNNGHYEFTPYSPLAILADKIPLPKDEIKRREKLARQFVTVVKKFKSFLKEIERTRERSIKRNPKTNRKNGK